MPKAATAPAREQAAPVAAPPPPRPRASILHVVAGLALMAVFAVQAIVASHRDSVTIDEFAHLPVGLNALLHADFRVDPVNAHLARMFIALPLLADPPAFSPEPGMNVNQLGYQFMELNGKRYQEIYEKVRPMVVLLALFAATVMAKWAYDLYGSHAALAAVGLFAFSPSLLAHGHLVTVDVAGTLGFLLALYANWKFLETPTVRRAVWLGVAAGGANLFKLSGAVLLMMIVPTWIIRMTLARYARLPAREWARLIAVVGAVALVTLNAGYAFDGTFGLLRDATLTPGGRLARVAAAMPWLRLPLPRPFLDGIDVVLEVGKGHDPSYFLAGELSADGWWYYHLAAFSAKCPLPVLAAIVFAMVAWLVGRGRSRSDYAVFVPVIVLFAANSAFNSLQIGERHVLPAYPLLFIGVSPWLASALASMPWRASRDVRDAAAAETPPPKRDSTTRDPAAAGPAAMMRAWLPFAAAAGVFVWTIWGTIAVAPRYLQFFNEAAGGPERGHRVLIDSNIDWGQDLIRLREYMDEKHLDRISLAYFGRVDPQIYGIRFSPLERGISHGPTAISASFLMGRPYFWILGGRMRWVPSRTYEWLQAYKPVARVGSMFVFDLP
ncbi:MAG TPA: glycosyltransferase family 39 protein [Candidatus Limnocylindrales bacterium]|nr:glycosyltransferase family 39 protein [Candidatus Limnocylindrales bacterium]